MRIQHNIMAMNAYRNYNNNTSALSKNLEKLSSGYKINRAGDDAAGLAISEKMRSQITGLQAAQKNVKDATNLVKTAEGALQEVQDMVKRMKYLATQSANGTYDDNVDRVNMQKEVQSLMTEIDRIADSANFNGIKLLNGDQSGVGSVSFTQATSTAAASFSLSLNLGSEGAKKLIGGSIQIGGQTFNVKQFSGTKALGSSAAMKGSILEVGENATESKIMSAVKGYLDGKIKVMDIDGNEKTLKATLSGSTTLKLQLASDGTGVKFDVSSLPTFSINGGLQLQIGDTSHNYNQMRAGVNDIHSEKIFLDLGKIDVSTASKAKDAVGYITYATNLVSSTRGDLGAIQNRLDHTANNLSVMTENITDAESSIRDTDVADEMMAYTKNNILIQSAQAMLAQANAVPQGVLQLLQ